MSASVVSVTMNEFRLIETISALVAKGDQAKERADRAKEKAQQFYVAAGQHLKTLKAQHTGTWAESNDAPPTSCAAGGIPEAPLQPSVEAVEPISNDYPEMPTFLER